MTAADDMGLGKSLVVISLIVSNQRGGTPPVPYTGIINGDNPGQSTQAGPSRQATAASSHLLEDEGGSSGRVGVKSEILGSGSKRRQQQVIKEADSDDDVQIIDPPHSKKSKV